MKKIFTSFAFVVLMVLSVQQVFSQIDYYEFGTGGQGYTMTGQGNKDLPSAGNSMFLLSSQSVGAEPYHEVAIRAWTGAKEVAVETDSIVKIFSDGAVIDNSLTTWTSNNNKVMILWHEGATSGTYGKFNESVKKFVAIRVNSGGSYQYGWIRISVYKSTGRQDVTIWDMAINTVPEQSIKAGQTVGINTRSINNKVTASYSNKHLFVNSGDIAPETINLQIFNMVGKEVYNGKCSSSVDLSFLQKGLYIVNLQNAEGTLVQKILAD